MFNAYLKYMQKILRAGMVKKELIHHMLIIDTRFSVSQISLKTEIKEYQVSTEENVIFSLFNRISDT